MKLLAPLATVGKGKGVNETNENIWTILNINVSFEATSYNFWDFSCYKLAYLGIFFYINKFVFLKDYASNKLLF